MFNLTDFTGFDICRKSYIKPKKRLFIICDDADHDHVEFLIQAENNRQEAALEVSCVPFATTSVEDLYAKIDIADLVWGIESTHFFNSKICYSESVHSTVSFKEFDYL